jgi:hypothetical protein
METRIKALSVNLMLFLSIYFMSISNGNATPSITSISGTVSNGQSITISGSGFGNGPNVVLFDDFEKGTNGSTIKTGSGSAEVGTWDSVCCSTPNPAYSNTTKVSGSLAMRSDMSNYWLEYAQAMLPSGTTQLFYSFWMYIPSGDSYPGEGTSALTNWKIVWLSDGKSPEISDFMPLVLLDSGFITASNLSAYANSNSYPNFSFSKGSWKRAWAWVDGANNHVYIWELLGSGVHQSLSDSGKQVLSGSTLSQFHLNGYGRQTSNSHPMFDDVYIATGANAMARIEIGNASTYSACTNLTVATPTNWSSSAITATVWNGSFANTSAYLYVFDSNGNVNSNGYPVTFGSSGGESSDSTPPTASISSPVTGAIVSGNASVSVSASDNVGVTKVELYVDGALSSTDTTSPYTFTWNTATASNGTHTLSTKAYDAANNLYTSTSISVTVSNSTVDTTAPTVSISSPTSGTTVSGNITVTASASDNVGVSKVEFYLDSATTPAATITSSPYTFSWNTTSVVNGTHTFKAKAYDAANNVGQSATVSVTVNNTSTPPASGVTRIECSNPPAGTIFCEDFEGTNPKADFDDYDGNPDTENLVVTDSGPSGDSANKEIRLRVPAGQRGTSDLLKVLPSSYDKLYARWYFKYEPGFNFGATNHGGGLAAGDRNYVGQSGNRPSGADFAWFGMQYNENNAIPYTYSYYRGMYQDCTDPNGSCWGDSLPCVYDNGASYCTKPLDRPTVTMPTLVAGQWYCYEQMVDMGAASTIGSGATGRITQWLDGNLIGDNTNLWLRTTSTLKLQNIWLSLFHHDGTHSTVGELIDNVVVSTQRIGCSTASLSTPEVFGITVISK